MNLENAKKVLAEWLEQFVMPEMVRRDMPPIYLPNMAEILAVVGPRRSGKTFYMYQLIGDMLAKGVCTRDEIMFVDFEDYRLEGMNAADMEMLLVAFEQLTGRSPVYLFFDEIQHIPNWSRVLRTLHNQGSYRIVVSGSNSDLLTQEISTELRGRYQDRLMLPFSFKELLDLREVKHTERMLLTTKRGRVLGVFDEYLKQGGFPEVLKKQDSGERKRLLQNYYRTVFYRDILERYNIRAKSVLETLMQYCMHTSSELFSISKFEKRLRASDLPASKRTISNYFSYLCEAFFLIANQKFSYSPRKRIMNPHKIYLLDYGFTALGTEFSENKGKALENAVAVELYRHQKETFYFKQSGECDFIVKDGTIPTEAIQVCWELNDVNRSRELRGLIAAMRELDIENGFILTYNQEEEIEQDGFTITVLPVWQWLLEGKE